MSLAPATTQLHTVTQVAQRLRVNRRTVLGLIHSGQLAAVNVGTGTKLPTFCVSDAALAAYCDSRRFAVGER